MLSNKGQDGFFRAGRIRRGGLAIWFPGEQFASVRFFPLRSSTGSLAISDGQS
jgi:hypothetical protein